MKTWQHDSKYFNYLIAYWHARMGLSLMLHPHLSLLLSLLAFVSQQLWCFCFQVCTAPPCQAATFKNQEEKSHRRVSLPLPIFPAILQDHKWASHVPPCEGSRVLLVGAAMEVRITKKLMLLGWIFTKGFSHSPGGVFEGDLNRKGRYKTNEMLEETLMNQLLSSSPPF